MSIKEQLESSPLNYELHLSYIEECKQSGDRASLKAARENFSLHFPLTEDLWLDWLNDETENASSKLEQAAVLSLFSRALQDYHSVSIYMKYASFVLTLKQPGIIDVARGVYEEAVEIMGFHMNEGGVLWQDYISLEKLINESKGEEEEEEEESSGSSRVISLYLRALSIPLNDSEDILSEAKDYLDDMEIKDNSKTLITNHYNTALKERGIRDVYERRLEMIKNKDGNVALPAYGTAEYESLAKLWIEYATFEKQKSNPEISLSRARCVIERGLTECCLSSNLWIYYLDLLENNSKDKELTLNVAKRAVRNITWSSQIWIKLFTVMEIFSEEVDDSEEDDDQNDISIYVYKACNSGLPSENDYFDVLSHFVGYYKRSFKTADEGDLKNAKEALNKLYTYYHKNLSNFPAMLLQLDTMLSRVVSSEPLKDTKFARSIWEDIFTKRKKEAYCWIEGINFYRFHLNNIDQTRKLYARGLKNVADYPTSLFSSFILFEQEVGNLKSLQEANTLVNIEKKKLEKEALSHNNKGYTTTNNTQAQYSSSSNNAINKNVNNNETVTKGGKKRILEESSDSNVPAKKPKTFDKAGSKNEQSFADAVLASAAAAEKKEVKENDEKSTIFVKNLSFKVTSADLKTFFSVCGEVTKVDLAVKHGKSRGMATIKFSTPEIAQKAVEMNGQLIDNRPINVEFKKSNIFDVVDTSKDLSKDEFASSLSIQVQKFNPSTIGKEEITKLFSKDGEFNIIDIFFHTDKEGKIKDHAIVQYDNVNGVQFGLTLNHSINLETESKLIVGPSRFSAVNKINSSKEKKHTPVNEEKDANEAAALVPKVKLKPAFAVPRSVGMKKKSSGNSNIVSKALPNNNNNNNYNNISTNTVGSNDDFRKMLGLK